MLNKLLKNNIFLTFFVSIIVFLIIYLFSTLFLTIDKSLSDKLNSELLANNLSISDKIVIVTIDDESVSKIWEYPFSRKEYIPVIENLKNNWAAVIGIDIIFADKSWDKNADLEFSKTLKNAWNIIIWWWILTKNNINTFQKPYSLFEKNVLSYWYFQPKKNKYNKKVYSINTFSNFSNGKYFHFAIQILRWYYWENYLKYYKQNKNDFYITPNLKIPVTNWKEFFINFTKENIDLKKWIKEEKYTTFSFYDISKNKINPKFLKDKIVIIGYTAKGIKDIFFSPEWQKFWVYTHANVINTILTKQYKTYFNINLEYILLFLLITLSVYFNISQKWKNLLISNISIISIFIIIVIYIIKILENPLNFPAEFLFALIITLTVSNILKSFMEDKNKTLLNKALSQYVSKDIAEEILSGEWKVKLDWERKRISIFFSDIEGFTSISEKMNPEELVIFLREYLWAMSNIIMDERGLIDKYEWDAIMALWWVFGYEKTSTYDNCISALEQQDKLKVLNKDWKIRFWEELKIRMWLNTWEAIVWNIWATGRKMEFTALGDSVNLASRLEEVNKKYWTYLCVSESVYQEQKDNFEFRYLDQIKVKWKEIPVKIYELISKKWNIDKSKQYIVDNFEKAIKLYLNKDFENALKIFKELSILWDNPSKTYIWRCDIFIKNPPEKDWDWVWTMMTK